MKGKIRFCLVCMLMIVASGLWAQESDPPSLLRLATTGSIGGGTPTYDELYQSRMGAGVAITYIPGWLPNVGAIFTIDAQRAVLRTQSTRHTIQMIRPEAGLQARVSIADFLGAYVQGSVGYGGVRIVPAPDFLDGNDDASSLSYRAVGGLELVFGSFVTTVELGWDSFVTIYNGLSGRIGLGWQFGGSGVRGTAIPTRNQTLPAAPEPLVGSGPARANITLSDFSVEPVFPVLYKYYDDSPLGTVTITNDGESPLEDVEIVLDMETYIDNPKVSGRYAAIAPGESVEVELAALFNGQVRSITEGEKVAAVVRTNYTINGTQGSDEETVTIDFYDRNAIRWDDDRKVAAFVTTRDSELQPLARNLAALSRQNRREAVSSNFQLAVMMFLGMVDQGLAYVIDPSSAYEDLSQNPLAVDSVQFPRQTLNYRGGDCDDLSVTFATLMESVGVPTAFLTIPGHIYVAFQLDMSADVAKNTFGRPEDLIFREDETVWVPVEITLLEGGFVEAWTTGAQQWREYEPSGRAGFIPTSDAWSTFQPVAYTGDEQIRAFNENVMEGEFIAEMTAFVKREIADRELTIKARLQTQPDSPRLHNRLGVLYARYGLTEEATVSFRNALGSEPYAPSLANLGNIAFLEDQYELAGEYYGQAVAAEPDNHAGLLGLARVSHELENYGTVSRYYDQIKELNPALAVQFAYLELRGDAASRASDAAQTGDLVFWGEEGEE